MTAINAIQEKLIDLRDTAKVMLNELEEASASKLSPISAESAKTLTDITEALLDPLFDWDYDDIPSKSTKNKHCYQIRQINKRLTRNMHNASMDIRDISFAFFAEKLKLVNQALIFIFKEAPNIEAQFQTQKRQAITLLKKVSMFEPLLLNFPHITSWSEEGIKSRFELIFVKIAEFQR